VPCLMGYDVMYVCVCLCLCIYLSGSVWSCLVHASGLDCTWVDPSPYLGFLPGMLGGARSERRAEARWEEAWGNPPF
jgi:hypothetical protein